MPRRTDTREKMIVSAALLIRERGVQGTSFADVLEHSGAPRGSIYHHFQGGKTELAEEAVRWAGDYIVTQTASAMAEDDPVRAIGGIRRQWSRILRDSDFRAGCPVVAATLEGEREPAVREVAADVFVRWEEVLVDAFTARAVPARRARSLATLVVSSIEGAIVLARAQRTIKPLERVAEELQSIVALAIAAAPEPAAGRAGAA